MQFIMHLIEKTTALVEDMNFGLNRAQFIASIITKTKNEKDYEYEKMDPACCDDRSIISDSICK